MLANFVWSWLFLPYPAEILDPFMKDWVIILLLGISVEFCLHSEKFSLPRETLMFLKHQIHLFETVLKFLSLFIPPAEYVFDNRFYPVSNRIFLSAWSGLTFKSFFTRLQDLLIVG